MAVMRKIVNWAHRGASGHAPENTLPAFRKAVAMGADGIECDIRETADGEMVVFHDATMKRLTGNRERISHLTCSEIKKRDAGRWFSNAFSGEMVPTLSEAIEIIPPPILLNLEIKTASYKKIFELIQKRGLLARTVLSSFDHSVLFKLREISPTLKIGYLVDREPWEKVFREAMALGALSLNIPANRVTPEAVQKAHKEGIKVHVYTVNEPVRMLFFIEVGIDGLFTNYPDRLSGLQRGGNLYG